MEEQTGRLSKQRLDQVIGRPAESFVLKGRQYILEGDTAIFF
jgi:hypothetical protein